MTQLFGIIGNKSSENQNVDFPRISFDVKKFTEEKGALNKIKFMWKTYKGSSLDGITKDRWQFASALASTSLRLAKRVTNNKEVKEYLNTASVILDAANLGVTLQNVFVPIDSSHKSPLDWAAEILDVKTGYLVTKYRIESNKHMVASMFQIEPHFLKEKLGITLLDIAEIDKGHRYLYQVESMCSHSIKGTIIKEPFKFFIEDVEQVYRSFMFDSMEEESSGLREYKMYCPCAVPAVSAIDGERFDMEVYRFVRDMIIPRAFCVACDFSKNYLTISDGTLNLKSKKELGTSLTIKNLDLPKMEICARKVLKAGKKWGVALVGDAGVGKTEAVKALVSLLDQHPILWVTSDCLGSASKVRRLFDYIRNIPGSIVVLDDMDSNEQISFKSPTVAQLILELSSPDNNFYMIATINDPSQVDGTLLDRPERFDEVIRIDRPKDAEMAFLVNFYCKKYGLTLPEDAINFLCKEMQEADFAHVHVSAAFAFADNYSVEKVTLDDLKLAVENIAKSSKNAYLKRSRGRLIDVPIQNDLVPQDKSSRPSWSEVRVKEEEVDKVVAPSSRY